MSKMSIIHATEKLKLRGALLYCNILKQFFVFILTHIIDIISIIGPKMSKMSIIHKTREKNFYPLFASTVCNAAINRPTVSLGSGEYIIPTGIV